MAGLGGYQDGWVVGKAALGPELMGRALTLTFTYGSSQQSS